MCRISGGGEDGDEMDQEQTPDLHPKALPPDHGGASFRVRLLLLMLRAVTRCVRPHVDDVGEDGRIKAMPSVMER